MKLITFIRVVILAFILDLFVKKYVKLSMVIITIFMISLIVMVDSFFIVISFSDILGEFPTGLKVFLLFFSILPLVLVKEYLLHTIRILDFCINKKQLMNKGQVEKGVICEIKSYGWRQHSRDGYYLIVDFHGEKIKSIPFRYHRGGTVVKNTYRFTLNDGKFNKEETREFLGDRTELYNVGDEIEVIVYKNKKYVNLKE